MLSQDFMKKIQLIRTDWKRVNKKIQENKRKEMASPKRFAVPKKNNLKYSHKSPRTRQRPPIGTNKAAVTPGKIKSIPNSKRSPNKAVRNNFKSPTAIRKSKLEAEKVQEPSNRNNVSASRVLVRRSRLERKANVEKAKEDESTKKEEEPAQPYGRMDSLMTNTIGSEMQEH
mmetsp:Transcript_19775/g.19399  ORF Transcript_19775/g.19399 Transcript_19775/m.19399 type:complete len:172 (-) Transcript_19775:259-774(-)